MLKNGVSESLRLDLERYPDEMDGIFYGIDFSGIKIDDETIAILKDNFRKMVLSSDGSTVQRLQPMVLKTVWESQGIDKSMPSIYEMICWIVSINEEEGVDSITFDEFIDSCVYFFSTRHTEQGLRRIFQLFDADNSNHIQYEEFKDQLKYVGIQMEEEQARYFFKCASGPSPDIDFEDFMQVMKKEYEF